MQKQQTLSSCKEIMMSFEAPCQVRPAYGGDLGDDARGDLGLAPNAERLVATSLEVAISSSSAKEPFFSSTW